MAPYSHGRRIERKVREPMREKWNVKLVKLLSGAKPDELSVGEVSK